jgi:hypothetical protein
MLNHFPIPETDDFKARKIASRKSLGMLLLPYVQETPTDELDIDKAT